MQISRKWLSDYLDLPDQNNVLDQILTNVGLEVEFIEDKASDLKGFIVGEVLTCEKHPNAHSLSVCTVSDGTTVSTVVCGAPNVAAGQKIIFAKPGAVVPTGNFTIGIRKLRGVESSGMICSTAELGLDDDHSGIAVLPADAVPGTSIAGYLGLDDIVFGIGLTPNRGDALSHIGVARDIAAATRQRLRLPTIDDSNTDNQPDFDITIDDADLCIRYSAALIEGVRVGPSPDWLTARLRSAGIRPVNNIVDATNYVLMEIGQPLHAFDRAKLFGNGIHVRRAFFEETIRTLDGVQRKLPEGALLICDQRDILAIAGVMGGYDSAVSDETTTILIESACFQSSSVRRTSRFLGLSTDASYRFERGSDPNCTVWAMRRACDLITEFAGGSLYGVYDNYPVIVSPAHVTLRPARCNEILGIEVSAQEQKAILEALSFAVSSDSSGNLLCDIPTFRTDITREIDLIEEIARIFGYDNIPVPTRITMNVGEQFDDLSDFHRFRSLWLGFGFDEIMSSSLVPLSHAGIEGCSVVTVQNPVSKERPALRSSLLPSLLEAVDHNIRNGSTSLRLFETGRCYSEVNSIFSERNVLAAVITGNTEEKNWYGAARASDFYDIRGVVEEFISAMHIEKDVKFSYDRSSTLNTDALFIEAKGRYTGQVVAVSEDILATFGIDQPVFYAEFEIDMLRKLLSENQVYRSVTKYPSVQRDLAVIVDEAVTAEALEKSIVSAGVEFLRDCHVVDIFRHESIGAGKKSMAYSMTFRADDRTLKDNEIHAAVKAILDALRNRHHAELRM